MCVGSAKPISGQNVGRAKTIELNQASAAKKVKSAATRKKTISSRRAASRQNFKANVSTGGAKRASNIGR